MEDKFISKIILVLIYSSENWQLNERFISSPISEIYNNLNKIEMFKTVSVSAILAITANASRYYYYGAS